MRKASRRSLEIAVIVLAFIGVFYRFAALDAKVYWHDEVYTSIFLSGYTLPSIQETLATGQPLSPQDVQQYQHLHDDKTLFATVRSLLAFDPHHPPLYYVALWSWAKFFGDSSWWIRAFSAFCGVLVIPAWCWWCRELFQSWRAAFIGLVLMAVSPFQVLYAQEARPYSIWSLAVCLASAALLFACRITAERDSSSQGSMKRAWWVYGAALVFGLYTHLLFVLVVAAHALWIWLSSTNWRRSAAHRVLDVTNDSRKLFAWSVGAAFVVYAPFLLLLTRRQAASRAHLDWTSTSTSLSQRWHDWTANLSAPFFDPQPLQSQVFEFRVLVALGVVAALLYTARRAPRSISVFVFALFLCSLLPFLLPDLLLGGRRSQIARFFIPAILALQMAVVFAFYHLSMAKTSTRRFGVAVAVLLVAGGLWSCEASRRSAHWWNKGRTFSGIEIAALVNRSPRPLLISDTRHTHLGHGVSLSKYLRPEARFIFQNEARKLILPAGFSDVYALSPSDDLRRVISNQTNYIVQKTSVRSLWKLAPRRSALAVQKP